MQQPKINGAALKRARNYLGFTQTALGEILGVSATTVSKVERGECELRLPYERAQRLRFNGIRPDYVLGEVTPLQFANSDWMRHFTTAQCAEVSERIEFLGLLLNTFPDEPQSSELTSEDAAAPDDAADDMRRVLDYGELSPVVDLDGALARRSVFVFSPLPDLSASVPIELRFGNSDVWAVFLPKTIGVVERTEHLVDALCRIAYPGACAENRELFRDQFLLPTGTVRRLFGAARTKILWQEFDHLATLHRVSEQCVGRQINRSGCSHEDIDQRHLSRRNSSDHCARTLSSLRMMLLKARAEGLIELIEYERACDCVD